MKQWIIDRYNKGQDKYKIYNDQENREGVLICVYPVVKACMSVSLYDFLFNPKWGFAKAFWGKELGQDVCKICGAKDECEHQDISYTWYHDETKFDISYYEYHLQQMAISPDPLKYLEQFKEES
jgi:hypothetical protein